MASNGSGWYSVTLDSGVAMSVTPAWWYPKEKKRTGAEYAAANGGKIADLREELRKFEFNDGDSGHMRFRLRSGSNVRDEGNRVVFGGGVSYVEPKSSGKRIPLRSLNGVYAVDVRAGCGHVKPKKVFRMQARRL